MKALRYLLMSIVVLGVLSVKAQTPRYGKTYNPDKESMQYKGSIADLQMPAAKMESTSPDLVSSGSTLPIAAVTGTSTTYDDSDSKPGRHIRRAVDGEDEDDKEKPSGWDDPMKDPLGDVLWPLMLLAGVYLIVCVARKRSRALKWSRSDDK